MENGRDVLNGYRLCAGSPSIGSRLETSSDGDRDFWGEEIKRNNIGAYGGKGVNCKNDQAYNRRAKKKQALLAAMQKKYSGPVQ